MLPILDFKLTDTEDPARMEAFARKLGAACRDVGFFYLRRHGLEPQFSEMFAAARSFFDLPEDEKAKLAISAVSNNHGYVGLRTEALDPGKSIDNKEAFNIRLGPRGEDKIDLWPVLKGFRETMGRYFADISNLGRGVHRAFALDLGLPADFFESRLDDPMSTLRLLHYPPAAPQSRDAFGAGEHTDYGNLTILLTDDAGGLQARRRDGTWIDVPYVKDAFVCNIGDCLMRWTNDVYVSTPHRVVNPAGRDRMSIAFFLDPNPDALVEPVPSCVTHNNPAKYPAIRADAYLASRFAATYGFQARSHA